MGADGKGCQAGGDIPIGAGEDSGLVAEGGSRAAADACLALPCVPCPYGSLGIGKDANGCETCPICAPPDAGQAGDVQPPTSCTAPSDCIDFPVGPAIACCIGSACVYGQAAGSYSCVDASAQIIMASGYDQACQKDSDCVAIEEGDFCQPGENNGCTNAAINRTALAQYKADLAKTTAGECYGRSGCGAEFGPCCQNGVCAVNAQCLNVVAGDASAEAGSTSAADAGPFMCAGNDGSVITCDGRTQYCQLTVGGAIGVTHPPACIDLPNACVSNRTCTCVNGAGSCVDNGGDITVTQAVP
jgi:hypothetical protein